MNIPENDSKRALRTYYRKVRNGFAGNETAREDAERMIFQNLKHLLESDKAERILFGYQGFGSEAGIDIFLKDRREQGKTTCLPRLDGREMEFRKITEGVCLVRHAFGMLEPDEEAEKVVPSPEDIFLVPGLAFSRRGDRLGYGGGYYDRFFSRYPYVKKIGVLFACQLAESLPAEHCDVRMDLLVTEKEIISCGKESFNRENGVSE